MPGHRVSLLCWGELMLLAAATPSDLVVPQTSGTFTVSDLLPRQTVAAERTGCPWDDPDLTPVQGGASFSDVTLPAGNKYLLSSSATLSGTLTVSDGAELIFADASFELTAHSIVVYGKLRVGSPTCRTSATTQHIITMTGARSDAGRGTVAHKGIVVSGAAASLDIFGALHQPSWSRLASTAPAGSTELYLQECIEWPIGAKIVVTTTHLVDWRRHNQNEEVTIASVACETIDYLADGASSHAFGKVTVTAPLQHGHYAVSGEYQAEVGLLSRNVLVRGDAADSPPVDPQPSSVTCQSDSFSDVPCVGYYLTGYGGHLIIQAGATGRVSAAEFYRMGQTNEIGRYPIHLHRLGEAGAASFVSDCSVHESYYRGVVVHGTNATTVTRNVAFDVIGHCYYMEAGSEERNEVSYNLGAHVHTIGHFTNLRGQATGLAFDSAFLNATIPADGAASPFYISNMFNNFTGNAAVGGFSGFAMVSFANAIEPAWPPGVAADESFVPKNRPSLPDGFYGNSARSTGYFWNRGACFYVGGVLSVTDDSTQALEYIPGRVSGPPLNRQPNDNGSKSWFTFVNTKASLCNIAGEDWNVRSKWYNMDVFDVGDRTFNAFGEVVFRNINVKCRTSNGLAINPPSQILPGENIWPRKEFKMFRAYDTGQSHVLDSWQIQGCGSEAAPIQGVNFRRAQIWSIPHGVNMPQNQLAMRNITYADGPPDPIKLFSFDVGQKDTYGAYYMNLLDADGSLTGRRAGPTDCRPTWVGSANTIRAVSPGGSYDNTPPNLWFKLSGLDDGAARGSASSGDSRCGLLATAEYPMWACDRGSISVAAIVVIPNNREQTTATTKEIWGRVSHFGDSLAEGPPLPGDHQVVGPHDHAHRGGWFLQYHSAADDNSSWSSPKLLQIHAQQIEDGAVLLLALAYPTGTTFVIQRTSTATSYVTYTAVGSVAAVRQDSNASTYYFDGTYLFLRMADVGAGAMVDFGEDGLFIPVKNPGWEALEITATPSPPQLPPPCPYHAEADGHSCGSRIDYLMNDHHVAAEYPFVCGACVKTDRDPTIVCETDADAGGYTCEARIQYLMDYAFLSEVAAGAKVEEEYPEECAGCFFYHTSHVAAAIAAGSAVVLLGAAAGVVARRRKMLQQRKAADQDDKDSQVQRHPTPWS